MEEQYVTFKTAKLAKEKGFNEICHYFYRTDGTSTNHTERNSASGLWCAAPTQSLLQRWLRETHNIFIEITYEFYPDGINYNFQVLTYDSKEKIDYINNDKSTGIYGDNGEYNTYELALEAALQKALSFIEI